MTKPKKSILLKRKSIVIARSMNPKFHKIQKKRFTKRISGTAKVSLELIGNTVYMPDLRFMQEIPFYIHHKIKLSPSILYEQMHFVKRKYIKSEMTYGTYLHNLFSYYLRQNKCAIVDFPSGLSSPDYYWISFKPDGIFATVNGLVLIELKTLPKEEYSKYSDSKKTKSKIPLKVEYQIQSYMNILKINKCLLCLYCFENGQSKIIEVDIDLDFVKILQKSFRTFIRLLFQKEGVQVKDIPKDFYRIQKFGSENKMVDYKGKETMTELKSILNGILKDLTNKKSQIINGNQIKDHRLKAKDAENQLKLKVFEERKRKYLKRREYFKTKFGRNTRS